MEHRSQKDTDATPDPSVPACAADVFGDRLEIVESFAGRLLHEGVTRGLIGPREAPRLWDRHLINCGVIAPAFTQGSTVVDIGTGAGLPGLVLALMRPDLRMVLVEPLERRTVWLNEMVQEFDLTQVEVLKARAEQVWGEVEADAVTSRAVASLPELARLSLPLLRVGGHVIAMKGDTAQQEVDEAEAVLDRLGVGSRQVRTYGEGLVDPPTRVVDLELVRTPERVKEPLGPGPALTAAKKKAKRRTRGRHESRPAGGGERNQR